MAPRADIMSNISREDLGYEPHLVQEGENGVNNNMKFPVADHYPAPLIDSPPKHDRKSSTKRSDRRRRQRTTAVKFCNTTITHTVEHLADLPAMDIWYSQDEYAEIKMRNSEIIRLIKSGQFMETSELSCRGLEHKLKEVFRQRRANKFEALNAVLEEQDRQICRGVVDPKKISAAYLTVSARCQAAAFTVALRDYRFSYCYSPEKPPSGYPSKSKGSKSRGLSPYKKDKKEKGKLKKQEVPDDDESLASTVNNDEKKKKGARRMLHGAKKRMMRRMSM